jgi:hypothetical protein
LIEISLIFAAENRYQLANEEHEILFRQFQKYIILPYDTIKKLKRNIHMTKKFNELAKIRIDKLEEVKIKLKQDFIGIDGVIDKIINCIKTLNGRSQKQKFIKRHM